MLKHDAAPIRLMQRVHRAIYTSGAPHAVKQMLNTLMDDSLGVVKDSRHQFQEEVCQMIESVLLDEDKNLEHMVQEAQEDVEKAAAGKAVQRADIEGAQAAAETQKQKLTAKQAELATEEQNVQAKVQICKAAQQDLDVIKNEVDAATRTQWKLEAALTDVVQSTKDGHAVSKDVLDSFIALCTAVKCDPSMLTSLQAAFGKAAGEVGPFDRIVIEQVREFLNAQVAVQKDVVVQSEAKISAAQATLAAANDELQGCIRGKESLESEVKSVELLKKQTAADVQAVTKKMKELESELESAAARAEEATAQLAKFREGALAACKQLAERSSASALKPTTVTQESS